MKRYGPYKNNAGYWFWIDLHDDGSRKTVLVSREALEKKIGRPLAPHEHAHHLDGDLDNNAPDNLEARDGREHRSKHTHERLRNDPALAATLAAGRRLGTAASVAANARRKRLAAARRAQRAAARTRPQNAQSQPPRSGAGSQEP